MALLEVAQLVKRYFGVAAVDHVNMEVSRGQIVGLIGPNGSGKTTLFDCVTRHLSADGGQVSFNGSDISHALAHEVALLGCGRTFQTVRVFEDLSVRENLLLAAQQHQEDSIIKRAIRAPSIRVFDNAALEQCDEALVFVGLARLREERAGNLSYGQRKLLAFAGCLVFNPCLVLLDEPTAAVNPSMIKKMKEQIRELNGRGITFLIIEHNMDFIMDLADQIVVLDRGQKIAEGEPRAIQANEQVLEAYLGRQ